MTDSPASNKTETPNNLGPAPDTTNLQRIDPLVRLLVAVGSGLLLVILAFDEFDLLTRRGLILAGVIMELVAIAAPLRANAFGPYKLQQEGAFHNLARRYGILARLVFGLGIGLALGLESRYAVDFTARWVMIVAGAAAIITAGAVAAATYLQPLHTEPARASSTSRPNDLASETSPAAAVPAPAQQTAEPGFGALLSSDETALQPPSVPSRAQQTAQPSLEPARSSYRQANKRLCEEITSLTKRANLHLIIAGTTTAAAVAILILTAANIDPSQGWERPLVYMIPRVSIATFVEVFSVFFLRMHRKGLDDVKYFQNELTNLDSRIIALESSLFLASPAARRKVIELLASTERNFKLGKDESTVTIESNRIESQQIKDALEAVAAILRPAK